MRLGRMNAPRWLLVSLLAYAAIALSYTAAFALLPKAAADRVNSPPLLVTCNRPGCHTPPAGADAGSVAVTGIPGCYVGGQVYDLTITVTDPAATRWGFELGVQYNEGNINDESSAGTLAIPAGQLAALVPSADGKRTFASHDASTTPDGTYPGQANSATWTVKWTAPFARQTQVCIYVAGVAANNNDARTGDRTYTQKYCINPCGPVDTKHSTWGSVKSHYDK